MIRRKTLSWWAGATLALILLLLLAWWWSAPSPLQTVKLPDGRAITLLRVTHGTHHSYPLGKPLARAVAPFLSAQWLRRYGVRTVTYDSATPTIVFWVQWPDSRGTNQSPSTAAVFDEQGNQSEPAWLSQSAYLASGEQLIAWAFANYPHGAGEIGLRIFRYDTVPQPRVIAEFRAPNAGPRQPPAWKGPPLPITRRIGDLDCTLVSLTAGKAVRSPFDMYSPYRANGNTALFQFTQQGTPTVAWRVAGLKAVEATGNICDTKWISSMPLGEYVVLEFDGALWQGDQAWKLDFELSRAAHFDPSELCTVRSVPVPTAPGTASQTNLDSTIQGIRLAGLRFERAFPLGPLPPAMFQRNAVVSLETAHAVEGLRVKLVNATDDRGRTVLHQSTFSSTNTVHAFELRLPPEAAHMDFTFAVNRSRFVEFLAKPVVLTSGFVESDPPRRPGSR